MREKLKKRKVGAPETMPQKTGLLTFFNMRLSQYALEQRLKEIKK